MIWIGLKYFCNKTDSILKLSGEEAPLFAIKETARMGTPRAEDVEDVRVIRRSRGQSRLFRQLPPL